MKIKMDPRQSYTDTDTFVYCRLLPIEVECKKCTTVFDVEKVSEVLYLDYGYGEVYLASTCPTCGSTPHIDIPKEDIGPVYEFFRKRAQQERDYERVTNDANMYMERATEAERSAARGWVLTWVLILAIIGIMIYEYGTVFG